MHRFHHIAKNQKKCCSQRLKKADKWIDQKFQFVFQNAFTYYAKQSLVSRLRPMEYGFEKFH